MRIAEKRLREIIKQAIDEMDFKDKESFKKYQSQHKMRPSTKVKIAGKETTVGAEKDGKKEKPETTKKLKDVGKIKKVVDHKNAKKIIDSIESSFGSSADIEISEDNFETNIQISNDEGLYLRLSKEKGEDWRWDMRDANEGEELGDGSLDDAKFEEDFEDSIFSMEKSSYEKNESISLAKLINIGRRIK
jgi:hypothetical protein